MKIVIDIPESDYNRIMASNEVEYFELKIAQGIVLPKGHGDLIDRDKIKPLMDEHFIDTSRLHYDDLTNAEHFNLGIENCLDEIDEIEPVIKADK